MKDLEGALNALLEPMASDNDLELVAVEVVGHAGSPVVRVLLDSTSGDGIGIDAILSANTWVSDALDAADLISTHYTLEVSSPGIERPLRKRSDWERFTGKDATVKTNRPIEGRKTFTGRIEGLVEEDVLLAIDDTTYTVPLDAIRKANLKANFGSNDEGKTR
jgi:ribosome maturation factor RimP